MAAGPASGTPADGTAIVSLAEQSPSPSIVAWRRANSACVSSEFEIVTYAQNGAGTHVAGDALFAIAIP